MPLAAGMKLFLMIWKMTLSEQTKETKKELMNELLDEFDDDMDRLKSK